MKIQKAIIVTLLAGSLCVDVYAQTPDLSLPPLPDIGAGLPPLPSAADAVPVPAPAAATAAMPAATATASTGSSPTLDTRASADSIDDLLPSLTATAPNTATTAPASTIDPLAVIAPNTTTTPTTTPAATTPADTTTTTAQATTPSLPPLPGVEATDMPDDLPLLAPPSLADEAAAKGIQAPNIGLPPLGGATAQALLSGQPLGSDEEEEIEEPEVPKAKQRKPGVRDLPRVPPSFAPLRHSYNYKRQVLPPSIYKREYSAENRHLPKATTTQDYDRHLFGSVAANNVNATRAFLNQGKSVNLMNANGETLLMVAVRYGALDTARLLLARGADPRLSGRVGVTPLQLAESSGQRTMAEVLRARGA